MLVNTQLILLAYFSCTSSSSSSDELVKLFTFDQVRAHQSCHSRDLHLVYCKVGITRELATSTRTPANRAPDVCFSSSSMLFITHAGLALALSSLTPIHTQIYICTSCVYSLVDTCILKHPLTRYLGYHAYVHHVHIGTDALMSSQYSNT